MFLHLKNILVSCFILVVAGVVLIAAPTKEQISVVHEGIRDALNTQDSGSVVSYFLDEATYDYVPLQPSMKGKEEIATFFDDVFTGFPDFHVEQRNSLISDNILITECTITATHMGEIFEIPGTGNPVQLIHMDIYEFEEDKIKHMITYDDGESFLVQFGVMPAPDLDPALLVPSFQLPDAEPTGLTPLEAGLELDALYDAHDLVNYAKKIHPDAEILLAPFGIPLNRDAFIAVLELYFLGFPDLNQEIERSIDIGDGWVLFEGRWKGMNDGPYFGLPATRRYSEVRGAWIARFDADGLLTNLSVYFDNITILANLGLFPPPNPEANKVLGRRSFEEIWGQGNLDVIEEIYGDEYIMYDPLGDVAGIDGYKQFVNMYRTAFPDIQFTTEDQIAEGNLIVGRWTSTGTHQGELMGIPATGKQITGTGITMSRVENSKIVEEWNSWDAMGMMQQLGAIPTTYTDTSWGASSEVTGDPGDPVTNTAMVLYVVQKFWNEQNVAVLDSTHSPDSIAHNPVIPGHPLSYMMYKHACLLHLAAIPDFHVTTENIITEGDEVAIRWTVNGTNLGSLMGVPPSGEQVKFSGMTIYRFADGKIVETWWAYDALGMMQQITTPPETEQPQE